MFKHNRPPYDLNSIGVNLVYTENPEPLKKLRDALKTMSSQSFCFLCALVRILF